MWYEDKHTISIVVGLLTVAWLLALLFITLRLQERHEDAWAAFGRPTLARWYIGGFQVVGFVLTDRHAQLNDAAISVAVWCARLVFPVLVVAVFYHEFLG